MSNRQWPRLNSTYPAIINNAECEVVQANLLLLVASYNDRSGDMLLLMQVSLVVDLIQGEHGVAEYRYGALMAA